MSAIKIGNRRELFVDTCLIDKMDGAFLKLHEPIPVGKVLEIDKPWEGGANFGHAVVRSGDKYLMYYRAMHVDTSVDPETHTCVALSDDGINWEKPSLQEGGTNFVELCCFCDEREGVDENEKFKGFRSEAVSGEKHTPNKAPTGAMRLVFYASPDGLNFHKMNPQPELVSELPNSFDGGNTMFWSEEEQQYVLYYRYSVKLRTDRNAPNVTWHRSVARMTSKDFYNWSKPQRMMYNEPSEQIYINNTAPYPRAPHIYLGVAARFCETYAPMSDARAKELPFETGDENIWKSFTNDCSDGVLLTSRAGSNYYDRTFMETFLRPGLSDSDWVTRSNYPLCGFVQYSDSEMLMYVNRSYLQKSWYIECLKLRTDGFASASAHWNGGTLTTKPLIFEGRELEINYRTGASGYIKVELLNEDGYVIPGLHADMCERIVGNEIRRVVKWRRDSNVDYALCHLAGKPVRIKFYLKDADLFSFKFN